MDRKPKLPKVKKVVTETVVVSPAKVGGPRVSRRRRSRKASRDTGVLDQYVNTLNDPFDFAPPLLGYGTFQSVGSATAYKHGTLTVAPDGSASLAMTTDLGSFVYYSNSGIGTATWSSFTATNQSVLNAAGPGYRVVSGGLRACPLVATTSTPGLVYSATTVGRSALALVSDTSTAISQYPGAHIGQATYGSTNLLRPVSLAAVTQWNNPVQWTTSTIVDWTLPVITFQSLPSGTQIAFEAVLNIELLPTGAGAGTVTSFGRSPNEGSLSQSYPNFEVAFSRIYNRLIDSVHLDFNEGGPNTNSARSVFGSSNARRAKSVYTQPAYNMSHLADDVKSTQDAAGVRMPSHIHTQTGGTSRRVPASDQSDGPISGAIRRYVEDQLSNSMGTITRRIANAAIDTVIEKTEL